MLRLQEAFGERLSLAAWRHRDGDDEARIARVGGVARETGVAVCATNRVLFAAPEDKPVFDVLHCIREGRHARRGGPRALAERRGAPALARGRCSGSSPIDPAWLARSAEVADACRFSMRELKYRFPCELDAPAFPGETPDEALRRLTYEGAQRRWPQRRPRGGRARRSRRSSPSSPSCEVAPYFLSVQTIVEIAREQGHPLPGARQRGQQRRLLLPRHHGGRPVAHATCSSSASSPPSAREPPDIDVDFEHERREEVIQAIYDKYGRDRAAMVSEIISYRGKSALREVGKVFGLSLEQVDRLGALVSWWDKLDEIAAGAACARAASIRTTRACGRCWRWRAPSRASRGTCRSTSAASCSAPSRSWTSRRSSRRRCRSARSSHGTRTTSTRSASSRSTCWAWGCSPRSARRSDRRDPVDDGARWHRDRATRHRSLARIPAEDPRVYDALCAADTVGVFQIESRAQMAMLPRLRPRRFYDLVVEVAIVRPGPIQGGMVHPYLRRRSGRGADRDRRTRRSRPSSSARSACRSSRSR